MVSAGEGTVPEVARARVARGAAQRQRRPPRLAMRMCGEVMVIVRTDELLGREAEHALHAGRHVQDASIVPEDGEDVL